MHGKDIDSKRSKSINMESEKKFTISGNTKVVERKESSKIRNLTLSGIMATMITLATAYICHVPVGINGGYVHFGDSLIYLAAALLPKPYAILAAAVGGGMADLLTAPMWMVATVIIKILLVPSFTSNNKKIICLRNVIATVIAGVISVVGYTIAEYFLFGTWSVLFLSLLPSIIQSVGSALFFVIFGVALDKANIKNR